MVLSCQTHQHCLGSHTMCLPCSHSSSTWHFGLDWSWAHLVYLYSFTVCCLLSITDWHPLLSSTPALTDILDILDALASVDIFVMAVVSSADVSFADVSLYILVHQYAPCCALNVLGYLPLQPWAHCSPPLCGSQPSPGPLLMITHCLVSYPILGSLTGILWVQCTCSWPTCPYHHLTDCKSHTISLWVCSYINWSWHCSLSLATMLTLLCDFMCFSKSCLVSVLSWSSILDYCTVPLCQVVPSLCRETIIITTSILTSYFAVSRMFLSDKIPPSPTTMSESFTFIEIQCIDGVLIKSFPNLPDPTNTDKQGCCEQARQHSRVINLCYINTLMLVYCLHWQRVQEITSLLSSILSDPVWNSPLSPRPPYRCQIISPKWPTLHLVPLTTTAGNDPDQADSHHLLHETYHRGRRG